MRVVFYLHTAQFAVSMSLLRELAQFAEVHVLLEVSPAAWQLELFEPRIQALPAGMVPADPVLTAFFPAGVRAYWNGLASFNLVVHHTRQSLRPESWRISHDVAGFVRRLRPDVIHFDEGSRRMLLALLELGRSPVVLTIHDPENHSGERHWRAEVDRFIFLRRTSRVMLYNRTLMPSFVRRYSWPREYVHATQLGVHHVFREWAVGPVPVGDRTILFYGRLAPYKGLEVLYEAASLVAERVPDVRVVVAGRPIAGYQLPPRPALPNNGQIEVIDEYIANARLAQLVSSARVIVCPYLDATQSGVVLTAFAFEKPVIATNVGGLPEYVSHGETGLLVPPRDAPSLASALIEVLTNAALYDRLMRGVARLGRDGRLDWASAARDTLAVYNLIA